MLRKVFITVSITVSCLALGPSLAVASPGVDVAKKEVVGKPAMPAGKQAKRSFVAPASSPSDRSWSSDRTQRESVSMSKDAGETSNVR